MLRSQLASQWYKHLAEGAESQAAIATDLDEPDQPAEKGPFETAADERAKEGMKRCITGLHDKDCFDWVRTKGKTKPHVQISDESKESSDWSTSAIC